MTANLHESLTIVDKRGRRALLVEMATRFGKNLNRCRKRAGFSQEELAVRASLHRTEIGLIERGERLPRIDTAVKLAGALGVPFDDLIEGIDWRPGSTKSGSFSIAPRPEQAN
jgi:transcriptional regulator with XRE-family HTH domain